MGGHKVESRAVWWPYRPKSTFAVKRPQVIHTTKNGTKLLVSRTVLSLPTNAKNELDIKASEENVVWYKPTKKIVEDIEKFDKKIREEFAQRGPSKSKPQSFEDTSYEWEWFFYALRVLDYALHKLFTQRPTGETQDGSYTRPFSLKEIVDPDLSNALKNMRKEAPWDTNVEKPDQNMVRNWQGAGGRGGSKQQKETAEKENRGGPSTRTRRRRRLEGESGDRQDVPGIPTPEVQPGNEVLLGMADDVETGRFNLENAIAFEVEIPRELLQDASAWDQDMIKKAQRTIHLMRADKALVQRVFKEAVLKEAVPKNWVSQTHQQSKPSTVSERGGNGDDDAEADVPNEEQEVAEELLDVAEESIDVDGELLDVDGEFMDVDGERLED